jgi:hypothetical protein
MKHPPILTPTPAHDGIFRISRSTPTGRSVPYPEPLFSHKAVAGYFCAERNITAGWSREDIIMARLRVHEVVDVEWEEILTSKTNEK